MTDVNAQTLFNLVEKNRSELRIWFPWVANTHCVQDSENFIASCNDRHWGICDDEKLVGVIGIPIIELANTQNTCELGFWLDIDHQGKGIMTKACIALIEQIFINSDIRTTIVKTHPRNERCMKLVDRLGFELVDDNELSEHIYHLTYSAWLDELWLRSKAIIPILDPDVMIRKNESIAYNKRLGKIYHLNEEGDIILRVVADGNKNITEITEILYDKVHENEDVKLFAYKIYKFLDQCSSIELTRKTCA